MTDHLPSKDVDDAPRPVWCEAVQDDIYYASEIDPYIQRLREELAREVGTREARVAEIDALRRQLAKPPHEREGPHCSTCACGMDPQQLEGPCPNCNQWVVLKATAKPPGDGQ
jgi:lipopolysaccharide biosynthesis regulator YciM